MPSQLGASGAGGAGQLPPWTTQGDGGALPPQGVKGKAPPPLVLPLLQVAPPHHPHPTTDVQLLHVLLRDSHGSGSGVGEQVQVGALLAGLHVPVPSLGHQQQRSLSVFVRRVQAQGEIASLQATSRDSDGEPDTSRKNTAAVLNMLEHEGAGIEVTAEEALEPLREGAVRTTKASAPLFPYSCTFSSCKAPVQCLALSTITPQSCFTMRRRPPSTPRTLASWRCSVRCPSGA